jgi:hypothetical protein
MKLNVKAFALASALVFGIGLFVLTWWMIALGGATGEPTIIGRVYPGFGISPLGSVIGFFWAFIDGFIAGAIFAWLYNVLVGRFTPET